MIKLENVKYKYKNNDIVLENININIKEGESICILGKNGAGKSTLAKLIAGIIKPTIGEILIDDISTSNKKETMNLRKKIGIVFQNPENQIIFSKVYDDIAFAIKNLKLENEEQRVEAALEKVDMKKYINANTHELSLGQKQRTTIAGVLAINTKYIVLDEATAMLDTKGKEEIYKIIKKLKEEGYTIIYTTNIAEEILIADKILIIDNKEIAVEIKREEIIEKIEEFKKYNIKIPKELEVIKYLQEQGINLEIKTIEMEEILEQIINKIKR